MHDTPKSDAVAPRSDTDAALSDTAAKRSGVRRAFVASLTGTALEWYDFAVYSAAAALVFGDLFFPSEDPLTGTLLAFSTYAVGYLSRPLGGFVFGRLGDVIGRKKVLIATLVLIGVATFLIGLLPAYGTIGVAAPIALVVLRFAQGVGVGGEWGGAVLLSSEFGDSRRRGFYASAAQVGPPAGEPARQRCAGRPRRPADRGAVRVMGLAGRVPAVRCTGRLRAVDPGQAGGDPGLQGDGGRTVPPPDPDPRGLHHPAPRPHRRDPVPGRPRRPLRDVHRLRADVRHPGTRHVPRLRPRRRPHRLLGPGLPDALAYALSDRVNRRLLYGVSAIAAAVWPFVFFPMAAGGSWLPLAAGVLVALVIHCCLYGPQAAFIAEQFSPRLRYTGSSLAYTLAGLIGGAIAPLLFTTLLSAYDSWVPLALYIALASTISLVGVMLGRNPEAAVDEDAQLAAPKTPVTADLH